jgi:hypothetical protein
LQGSHSGKTTGTSAPRSEGWYSPGNLARAVGQRILRLSGGHAGTSRSYLILPGEQSFYTARYLVRKPERERIHSAL